MAPRQPSDTPSLASSSVGSSVGSSASSPTSEGRATLKSPTRDRLYYTNMIEMAKRVSEEELAEDYDQEKEVGDAPRHRQTAGPSSVSPGMLPQDEAETGNEPSGIFKAKLQTPADEDTTADSSEGSEDLDAAPSQPRRRSSRRLLDVHRSASSVIAGSTHGDIDERRKFVSFNDSPPDKLEIDSHREYSSKERARCWYSETDKAKMLAKHERVVARLENQRPCKPTQTYRGLESWTVVGATTLDAVISRCVDAVMDEQDRQWRANEDEMERIAAVASEATAGSVERALAVALEDELEAAIVRQHGWQEDDMSVSVSMSVLRAAGQQKMKPNRRLRSLSPSRAKGRSRSKDAKGKGRTSSKGAKSEEGSTSSSKKSKEKKKSKRDREGKLSSSESLKQKEQAKGEQTFEQEEEELLAAVSAGTRAAAAALDSTEHETTPSRDSPKSISLPFPPSSYHGDGSDSRRRALLSSSSPLVETLRKRNLMQGRPLSASQIGADGSQPQSPQLSPREEKRRTKESDPPGRRVVRNPSHLAGEVLGGMRDSVMAAKLQKEPPPRPASAVNLQPESDMRVRRSGGARGTDQKVQKDADGRNGYGSEDEGTKTSRTRCHRPERRGSTGEQWISGTGKSAQLHGYRNQGQDDEDVERSPSTSPHKKRSGMKVLKRMFRSKGASDLDR